MRLVVVYEGMSGLGVGLQEQLLVFWEVVWVLQELKMPTNQQTNPPSFTLTISKSGRNLRGAATAGKY
jgi:hypothetical protein